MHFLTHGPLQSFVDRLGPVFPIVITRPLNISMRVILFDEKIAKTAIHIQQKIFRAASQIDVRQ